MADPVVLNPPGQVSIPLVTFGIVIVCNPMDFVALLNMNKGIKIQSQTGRIFLLSGKG